MSIAILGVNHKTAPVILREKVAFSPEVTEQALYSLCQHPLIEGAVILSTCNRTEIYLSYELNTDLPHIKYSIKQWLCQFHKLILEDYSQYFYWYESQEAITHLMQVCCGVDSMIIGEPQILGQVKQAYHIACQNSCLSLELDKLFQKAFFVAKKVRTETKICSNSASLAYFAGVIAKKLFNSPNELNVLLVGAGETIELIARYLKPHGFNKIIVANRTRDKAIKLADLVNGEIISLPDIATRLKEVDIVISSTASPLPIIGKGMVERSMAFKKQQSSKESKMLFIDLAVPCDIEQEINQLENIFLYTIDDLQQVVQSNIEQRVLAAKEANHIIVQEAKIFSQWLSSRCAVELIKQYRNQAELIQQELTTKAIHLIKQGGNIDEIVNRLSHQLTKRLIHAPTISLLQASKQDCHCLKLLSQSLGLDESKISNKIN